MKMESVGAFHSTQNSGNFGWFIKWNGPFWFGPAGIFGTSFEVGPLWPVWLFRPVGRKCPSPFDKIVVPVLLFWILLIKKNNQTRGGLDRVCAPGMYRSTGHVKFPKFQTRIFVEWKAPCVLLQACEAHVLYTTFLCIKKPVLGKTKTTVLQSFS